MVTDDKLPYWHEFLAKEDPNISKALGKKAKIERMKAGMLHFTYVGELNGDQYVGNHTVESNTGNFGIVDTN